MIWGNNLLECSLSSALIFFHKAVWFWDFNNLSFLACIRFTNTSSPSAFQICLLELFSLHVIGDSDLGDVFDDAELNDDGSDEVSDDAGYLTYWGWIVYIMFLDLKRSVKPRFWPMDLVELMLKNSLLSIYQAKIISCNCSFRSTCWKLLYVISITVLQDKNSQMCRHSNLEYNKTVFILYTKSFKNSLHTEHQLSFYNVKSYIALLRLSNKVS